MPPIVLAIAALGCWTNQVIPGRHGLRHVSLGNAPLETFGVCVAPFITLRGPVSILLCTRLDKRSSAVRSSACQRAVPSARGDHALRAQDGQIMRDGRFLQVECRRQLLHGALALSQQKAGLQPAPRNRGFNKGCRIGYAPL